MIFCPSWALNWNKSIVIVIVIVIIVFWMSCNCKYHVALPYGDAGWSAVCDFGIS